MYVFKSLNITESMIIDTRTIILVYSHFKHCYAYVLDPYHYGTFTICARDLRLRQL